MKKSQLGGCNQVIDLLLKPACKNFGDDLKDVIDETDRSKITNMSGTSNLEHQGNICSVKLEEIKISIIKSLEYICEILSEN